MTKWQFDEGMVALLKGMIGKQFRSLERAEPEGGGAPFALRVNLDGESILLKTEETEVFGVMAEFVPRASASKFACEPCDGTKPFAPERATVTKRDVGERVIGAEIVSDLVQRFDPDLNAKIDIAVVIKTERHAYLFSKGLAGAEEGIRVEVDEKIDDVCPLRSELTLFGGEKRNAAVARVTRTL